MPSFSPRTLSVTLLAIALVFLTALTLTPRPNLHALAIPSPFARSHESSPRPCSQLPHQQASLSHQDSQNQQQPTWLLATVSAYFSQRRRNIIRATWQSLYPNPAFDTRFVLAKPSPLWQPLIKHENDTYGDLIVLEHLEESAQIANTIKSVEFFKHLVSNNREAHPSWQFVSKIDDDSFLVAERFYREFLLPRLHDAPPDGHDDERNGTLIARRLVRPNRPFDTPGGQFYTLSFNLLPLLATAHTQNPIADLAEDVLIGKLLYDAQAEFEFVELDDRAAFDVGDDGAGRLGKEHEELGGMDKGAINPHKMKDDGMYLKVAGLFGREGWVGEGG